MPDVKSIFRHISQRKYIKSADLTNALITILWNIVVLLHCSVVYVYTRAVQWECPGQRQLLFNVSRSCNLIEEVAKIADDLFCGGDTPETLFNIWKRLPQALKKNGLNLAAKKTIALLKNETYMFLQTFNPLVGEITKMVLNKD